MTSTVPHGPLFELDHEARRSFTHNGFAVLGPAALSTDLFLALRDEAEQQVITSSWSLTGDRGNGEIQQETTRAHLGPVARGFCEADETLAMLHRVSGRRLRPGWSATCYTAYEGPTQHLGEHCDKQDECAVALLVYLTVQWGPTLRPSRGLQLRVYEGMDSSTPILANLTARENRVIVLHGSRHAHLRPPLAPGERMVALTACFGGTSERCC